MLAWALTPKLLAFSTRRLPSNYAHEVRASPCRPADHARPPAHGTHLYPPMRSSQRQRRTTPLAQHVLMMMRALQPPLARSPLASRCCAILRAAAPPLRRRPIRCRRLRAHESVAMACFQPSTLICAHGMPIYACHASDELRDNERQEEFREHAGRWLAKTVIEKACAYQKRVPPRKATLIEHYTLIYGQYFGQSAR